MGGRHKVRTHTCRCTHTGTHAHTMVYLLRLRTQITYAESAEREGGSSRNSTVWRKPPADLPDVPEPSKKGCRNQFTRRQVSNIRNMHFCHHAIMCWLPWAYRHARTCRSTHTHKQLLQEIVQQRLGAFLGVRGKSEAGCFWLATLTHARSHARTRALTRTHSDWGRGVCFGGGGGGQVHRALLQRQRRQKERGLALGFGGQEHATQYSQRGFGPSEASKSPIFRTICQCCGLRRAQTPLTRTPALMG